MARDLKNQHYGNWGGQNHDWGYVTYSGTGADVEVSTNLEQITGVSFTSGEVMTSGKTVEYYLNETLASGGYAVPSGGSVTITRIAEGSGEPDADMTVFYHFIGN
tara:strand:- start:1386 stop:1700 length:315 start_codon:yes stop_codon:yes gene_type:complete